MRGAFFLLATRPVSRVLSCVAIYLGTASPHVLGAAFCAQTAGQADSHGWRCIG